MFLNFFKYLNKKILFLILFITAPLINADWFALNMTRGITDISNEVFELHMLIFWICVVIGVLEARFRSSVFRGASTAHARWFCI